MYKRKILLLIFTMLIVIELFGDIRIAFRNDDLSANSNPVFEYDVLQVFRKYEIKPLFGVIPKPGGKNELTSEMAIADSLRSWYNRGWIDLAIHGYTHEKKWKFGSLDFGTQNSRIAKANEILTNALGCKINYFCPPWNSANKNTLKALKENDIRVFSGYLGEPKIEGMSYLNCNCNLFNGPLGDLPEKIDLAIDNNNDVFLVALYHTNYDFKENSLIKLDSLLNYVTSLENVNINSFSGLIADEKYSDLLNIANKAGYQLKFLKNNKYIRKIVLRIPIINDYMKKQTMIAEDNYWTGNYKGVNKIYSEIFIMFWIIVSLLIIAMILLIRMYYKSSKIKGK